MGLFGLINWTKSKLCAQETLPGRCQGSYGMYWRQLIFCPCFCVPLEASQTEFTTELTTFKRVSGGSESLQTHASRSQADA